jgi:hypothetical protein
VRTHPEVLEGLSEVVGSLLEVARDAGDRQEASSQLRGHCT